MPSRRLETLLLQAQAHQRNQCAFHTSDAPFSLLEDHVCPRSAFPNTSNIVLAGHSDEVWTIAWSPDGGYLATASADQTVIIWDLRDPSKVHNVPRSSDQLIQTVISLRSSII